MKRLKNLSIYQKTIILLMTGMMIVFAVLYHKTISREGYLYLDTILVQSKSDGATLYSGKIDDKNVSFLVSEDRTVIMTYDTRVYGPYRYIEDPDARPETHESIYMIGIEIRQGEEVIFRGAALKTSDGHHWLYNSDGTIYSPASAIVYEGDRVQFDSLKPTVNTIADLMLGPSLKHKGTWFAWFGALFICLAVLMSMLYCEELFRWQLSHVIRDYENAEPSDSLVFSQKMMWTIFPFFALYILILGLKTVA